MTTSRRLLSSSVFLFLAMIAVHALPAQDTNSAQPDGVTKGPTTVEKPDPLKRPLSDIGEDCPEQGPEAGVEGAVQEVDRRGRALDHHRPGDAGVQEPGER